MRPIQPNCWPFWKQLGATLFVSCVLVALLGWAIGIGPHMVVKKR